MFPPTQVFSCKTIRRIAPFPFKAGIGTIYTGIFNVTANYCANGVGNISDIGYVQVREFVQLCWQLHDPGAGTYATAVRSASPTVQRSHINIPVTPSLAITQGLT